MYEIGNIFGHWTIISKYVEGKHPHAWCKCSCGTKKFVCLGNLRSGKSTSCGCYRKAFLMKAKRTHGHSINRVISKTYGTWSRMMQRCYNKNGNDYRFYGAKGVSVCDAWHTFEGFLADMGEKPNDLTLDRINPFKNYEPENCRWATWAVQYKNKRSAWEARA